LDHLTYLRPKILLSYFAKTIESVTVLKNKNIRLGILN